MELNNGFINKMGNFFNDLKNAKKAEELVKQHLLTTPGLLNKLMKVDEPTRTQLSDFDYNFHCSLEVKNDKYPSANFAFEYYNPKKEKYSGVWISLADYIVYVTDKALIYFDREELKEELIKHQTTPGSGYQHKKNVGDGNANIVLYKKEFIINNFKSIKYIELAN